MSERDTATMPNLARVEAINVRVPFRRPLLDATGEYTHRRAWLLRLADERGREGLGEAVLDPFADDEALGALARMVREWMPRVLLGRYPKAEELAAEGRAAGRALMAGLEGALGGLAAQSGSVPSSGPAPSAGSGLGPGLAAPGLPPVGPSAPPSLIPVCAVIAFGGPDAGADAAAQAIELGFKTLKIRAGYERTTEQLVDRVRALRGAVGPEPRIRVDAGGAWSLDVAAERLTAIQPFRLEFVEQPLAAYDLTGHTALRERVPVPVALDEAIDSEGAARAALAERAADFLVVKPARVGGTGPVWRIAEAAAASGVPVVLGTYFETGVGIAAGLRVAAGLRDGGLSTGLAHGLATGGILAHDLLAVPLAVQDGHMAVPGAVALDEAEVARYAIERFEAAR
jgi:L-alanine-DL-glutamate epimerase-like enolase superfamily enzyme